MDLGRVNQRAALPQQYTSRMIPMTRKRVKWPRFSLVLVPLVVGAACAPAAAKDKIDFHRDIRPILSEACFQCHGPDEKQRKADLRLDREGLKPSPEADKVTLLRRLSLDLIGLPPTIGEVDAFLADKSPGAYKKQVERLLDSPHYGERWGRHWLDAARYADSDGYEKDTGRPSAWRYRDWVIQAHNADLPYNQFVIYQLAADLLPVATQDQRLATGFHRNTLTNH